MRKIAVNGFLHFMRKFSWPKKRSPRVVGRQTTNRIRQTIAQKVVRRIAARKIFSLTKEFL